MNRFVSPSPFDVRAGIEYLLMAVVGGLATCSGALVGAAVVLLLKNGCRTCCRCSPQRAGQLEAVVFAVLFILLLHHARGGLMGFVRALARRRVAARRRRLRRRGPLDAPRSCPSRGAPILTVPARSSASAAWSPSTT